jgi:hypothetical protein
MSLPYENTTAGQKALNDIQKLLRDFGCNKFGVMNDDVEGTVLVQFEYRGKPVSVKASVNGYAAAWLKEHPYSNRMRCNRIDHEKKSKEIASIAVCSIIRDWIKAQIMIIETGVLSFEGAFLGQLLLENGKTVLEHASDSGFLKIESK